LDVAAGAVGTACAVGGVCDAAFGVRHRPEADGAPALVDVGAAGVTAARPACGTGALGAAELVGQRPEVDKAAALDARVVAAAAGALGAAVGAATVPTGDDEPDRVEIASDAGEFPTAAGRGGGLAAGGGDAAGAGRGGGAVGIAGFPTDLAGAALRVGATEPALGDTMRLAVAAPVAAVAPEVAFDAAGGLPVGMPAAEAAGRAGPVANAAFAVVDVVRVGAGTTLAATGAVFAEATVGAAGGNEPVDAVDAAGADGVGFSEAAPAVEAGDDEPDAEVADPVATGAPDVVPTPTGLVPRARTVAGIGDVADVGAVGRAVEDSVATDGVEADVPGTDDAGPARGGGTGADLLESGSDNAVASAGGKDEPGFSASPSASNN
jgi:hypothetical protein